MRNSGMKFNYLVTQSAPAEKDQKAALGAVGVMRDEARTHLGVQRNFNSMRFSANYSLNKRMRKKKENEINFLRYECMMRKDE